ncbi:MAG: M16 family metallopeptidase [Candidatus Binatia bacterium]
MDPAALRIFHVERFRVVHERSRGPVTGIALAVRSGSRFDGASPGMAHLAEHMLFQGTARRSHQGVNERAAELGGDHDANTGYEDLNLTFQVLNGDVAQAIALIAEQVLSSTVPEDRLENESQVVAQEIRGHREDAISYLCDETWSRFFAGGLSWPPSGTLGSVRRIRAPQVRRFLRERLVGSNMVLSVVGDVPTRELRRTIAREFRALPAGRPVRGNGARIARSGEARFRRSGLSQLYMNRIYAVSPAPRPLVGLGMALEILGTDPDGRLYHEVRERQGLSYDLWADLQVGAGWATMQVGAVAPRRAENRLQRAIADVFARAAEDGFTDEEIARARRKVRYRYARLSEAKLDRAAAHAASALYGALSLADAEEIVRTLTRREIEAAWQGAIRGRSLIGVLTG